MKKTILLTILSLAVLAFTGCGETATNTVANNTKPANSTVNSPAANNAATPAATPTAKADLPPSDLKPADINLDKPVPAAELRNAVFADEAAWMGKEVAVIGEYNGHSTSKLDSGDKHSINVQDDNRKVVINCDGRVAPPDDVKDKSKDRVFKGTVKSVNKSYQQVYLEPCEVIK